MIGAEAAAAAEGTPRRLAAAVLALTASAIGAYVVLRLLAPYHDTGWDEAYYLGIGANLLDGQGLQTAFGEFPSIHSPLWPLVLQAPSRVLGIDPTTWGHPLVVASGAAVIGATGWYAGRSVRLAAPLAVASMIAFPFLLDLAGWMGLDLPSAAMMILYVGLGIAAVRRGSFAIGLAAGLAFAVAFLVKESALPLAPVPVLAGLLRSTTLASIGRAASGILLAATVATSWWFVVYAQELGLVYRLGTPAWTLVPLGIAMLALVGIGLSLRRIAPWTDRPLERGASRWAARLGWLGTLVWAGLLGSYFAVAPNPLGVAYLEPAQIAAGVARFGRELWPPLALGLTGSIIAVVDRIRPVLSGPGPGGSSRAAGLLRPDDRRAVDDLVVAIVCGLPFVLLVFSVGEGPRHYIAYLGFVVALGAIGWTRLLVAVAHRPSATTLVLVGLGVIGALLIGARVAGPARWLTLVFVVGAVAAAAVGVALALGARRGSSPATPWAPDGLVPTIAATAALVLVVVTAAGVAASVLPDAPSPIETTRASVVATTSAWVREHLEPGSTVVFGAGLAMETSVELVGDYRMALVAEEQGIDVDASAPVGLRAVDGAMPDDWVALTASRRDASALVGFRAGPFRESFGRLGAAVWIHSSLISDAAGSPSLEAFDRALGFEVLERWSWPYGDSRYETVVYRVDPDRLVFSDDIMLDRSALARIVLLMERDPDAFREAAAVLSGRVVLISREPDAAELLGRLHAIAGS